MRHIRVLVCQVDDSTPDLMTELACFDLATPNVATPFKGRSEGQEEEEWGRQAQAQDNFGLIVRTTVEGVAVETRSARRAESFLGTLWAFRLTAASLQKGLVCILQPAFLLSLLRPRPVPPRR